MLKLKNEITVEQLENYGFSRTIGDKYSTWPVNNSCVSVDIRTKEMCISEFREGYDSELYVPPLVKQLYEDGIIEKTRKTGGRITRKDYVLKAGGGRYVYALLPNEVV